MRPIHHSNLLRRISPASNILLCGASLVFAVVVLARSPAAQMDPASATPYASINRDAVNYAGPGREAAYDLRGDDVAIGMFLPLRGAQEAEGKALLQAAQLAIEDEAANPLPDGRRLTLAARDESGSWGRASSEIVRLIFEDRAVALITSTDGGVAHLAEQIANKAGVPIFTLSSDATTTQINLPWIFRLGPSDGVQAQAFARRIYRERAFRKVLLLTQHDHDGRLGSEEFEKAARRLHAPPPDRLEFASSLADPESAVAQIEARSPEAIVLWTGPESAAKLLPAIRQASPSAPIYLCRKAAQIGVGDDVADALSASSGVVTPSSPRTQTVPSAEDASAASLRAEGRTGTGIWVVVPRSSGLHAIRREFEQRYRSRTGTMPSIAAAQAYDAVRLIATALRQAGPNRARLRDRLAAGISFPGISGVISFDRAGNALADFVLVEFRGVCSSAAVF